MKLGMTVSIGGYSGFRFDSNEFATREECARDLIKQMEPLAKHYPTVAGAIAGVRSSYGV